jgi:predicted N-acyltransferase
MPLEIAVSSQIVENSISMLRNAFKNFLKLDLIFAGSPIGEENYFIIDDNVDDSSYFDICCSIISSMEEFAKSNGIKYLAFKDMHHSNGIFTEKQNSVIGKYNFSPGLPNNIIENKWDSFEDYLNSLKHSQRRNIKRNIKISTENGLKINWPGFNDIDFDEIYGLYQNTLRKAPIKFETLTPEYFHNTLKYMGEQARIITATVEAKIVGFLLFLIYDNVLLVKRLGLDYDKSQETLAYYRLFFSAIEYAIEKKVNKIILGQQSYHSKSRWGAKIIPGAIYFKSFDSIMNKIMKKAIPWSFSEFSNFDNLRKK